MTNTTSYYSTLTKPLTDLSSYQKKERKSRFESAVLGIGKDDFWQTSEELGESGLSSASKVRSTLSKVRSSIEDGSLFNRIRYEANLIVLRHHNMGIAGNETIMRYESDSLKIQKNIVDLSEKISKIIEQKDSLDSLDISGEMSKIPELIQKLFQQVAEEKKLLKENPIAIDRRCYKGFVKVLDANYMTKNHDKYLSQFAEWKKDGFILENFSNEQCWQWKGSLKALKRIKLKVAYLAHNIHKIACCVDSLKNHVKEEKYWEINPQEDAKERAEKAKAECERLLALLTQRGLGGGLFGGLSGSMPDFFS